MTAATTEPLQAQPPIATGWLLWLTWIVVVLFVLSLVSTLLMLVMGPDEVERLVGLRVRIPSITWWWIIKQAAHVLFAVACVGVLLRNRDWASIAVTTAWIIVGIQCLDAALQIFRWRLSVPIGAVLYVAFALKTASVLRLTGAEQPAPPPGSGGML